MTTSHDKQPVEREVRAPGVSEPIRRPMEVCAVNDAFDPCETAAIVDAAAKTDGSSPIDQFIRTAQLLNVLRASRASPNAESAAGEGHTSATAEELEALEAIEDLSIDHVTAPGTGETEEGAGSSAFAIDAPRELVTEGAVPSKAEVDFQLNGLVLLGLVSAVESYLRGLTTKLVWVDEYVARKAEDQKLPYAAARYQQPELLAEAFLEELTLISKDQVSALIRDVIGVQIKSALYLKYLNEYDRICQLRHCIVHRFGKLGSKNAIKLGLREHSKLMEKPIKISSDELEKITFNLLNFVQIVNNVIYDEVLRRQGELSPAWEWDEAADLDRFTIIYTVFQRKEAPTPSPDVASAYAAFKEQCEFYSVKNVEKQKRKKELRAQRAVPAAAAARAGSNPDDRSSAVNSGQSEGQS